MIVLLLLVVFTGLGLAMLQASATHLAINGTRKFSLLLDCAAEDGLKRGLAELATWLEAEALLAPVTDEAVEAMRTDPAAGFPRLLEAGLGAPFPRLVDETFDGLTWASRADCGLALSEDLGGHLRITAAVRIESSGGRVQAPDRRRSVLAGSLGFLAGRIPLAAVPLYIDEAPAGPGGAAFIADSGLRLASRPGEVLAPAPVVPAAGVLPDDAAGLAARALDIGVFRPGDLSPARLRQAIGLEISTDPVPEGVYLIRNDLGLGGVFVQGDVDEMILAVRGDTQIVVFRRAELEWRLAWSPARSRTDFSSPEGVLSWDLVPLPLVFVNGAVAALGGGEVGSDDRVEMSFDGRTQAVLDGVDLTIVSTGRVTIASHLVLEGVRWQNGIPYAKGSEAQLVIYASGRDPVTGERTDGGIAVAGDAPSDLRIQASLTAAAGGFRIEGTGRTVELTGALHADTYEGNGNALSLYRDDRAGDGILPRFGPATAAPMLAVFALKVLSWEEY